MCGTMVPSAGEAQTGTTWGTKWHQKAPEKSNGGADLGEGRENKRG